jgi:hypothetical protein
VQMTTAEARAVRVGRRKWTAAVRRTKGRQDYDGSRDADDETETGERERDEMERERGGGEEGAGRGREKEGQVWCGRQ